MRKSATIRTGFGAMLIALGQAVTAAPAVAPAPSPAGGAPVTEAATAPATGPAAAVAPVNEAEALQPKPEESKAVALGKQTFIALNEGGNVREIAGLLRDSVNSLGGWRVQGRSDDAAEQLIQDAIAVQNAGAFALVLEMVPAELAAEVTAALAIPTIGIGAGPSCDGQVLVCNDLLGLDMSFSPKFLKRYAELENPIKAAVSDYIEEVRAGTFPTEEQSFHRQRTAKKITRLY